MKDDGGYYNGKWHSPAFMECARELEDAFHDANEWLIERIFARLENEAEISFEEYMELCKTYMPKE